MCVLASWRTPLGWISFAIALSLTWGGLWLAGWTFTQMQPVKSEVRSVKTLNAPARTVVQMLQVVIATPHTANCTRLSQNMLFQDEHGTASIYPLGSSMSGDGLGIGWMSVTQHDFVLNLPIPAAIPDGEYKFLYRSVYLCSWLGGVIQNRLHYDSLPVLVRVGTP